jgi:nucleoside-triphosphatase THEP1
MTCKDRIFIITGEARSGKTLIISNLISELRKLRKKVTGVYSPARSKDNEKTGIYLVNISSQNLKLLANYQPGWDPENPKREWKMDPEVLKWGNKVIRESVPTSVLIIDELGFMEFEKNQGWISAFDILENGDYKLAIVVVRTGLLNLALARWETAKVIYVNDPSQCRTHIDFLMDQILAIIDR